MTKPIAAVAAVATTPDLAKVLAARLNATDIPAFVEGDSLEDAVGLSRRLMNTSGTRVMVPSQSIAAAKEILDAVPVDDAELEAQALAAADPEQPPQPSPRDPPRRSRWPLLLASTAALTFLALWLAEIETRASEHHPLLSREWMSDGLRERSRVDGSLVRDYEDRNRDGMFERLLEYCGNHQRIEATDHNRDTRYEEVTETRRHGWQVRWTDDDLDGLLDRGVVTDANGKQVQELRWVDGKGFVASNR